MTLIFSVLIAESIVNTLMSAQDPAHAATRYTLSRTKSIPYDVGQKIANK